MRQTITIASINATGFSVPNGAFGINYAFNFQQFGDQPWEKFDEIAEDYYPSQIRYPAGTYSETVFDLENPDAISYTLPNGEERSLTPMTDMLNFSITQGIDAVIVIPTSFAINTSLVEGGHRTFDESKEQILKNYILFLLEVAEPNVISRLEIGNEYAAYMTAVEYGRIASRMVEIIDETTSEYKKNHNVDAEWQDPTIAVQILGQSPGGGHSIEDLDTRNANVLAQFSDTQLSHVDALVDHFYYFDERNRGEENHHTIENISEAIDVSTRRIDIWEQETGRDLLHIVSEWNVSHGSENTTGLSQIPYILEMFSSFVADGIDELDFWSSQYHGTSIYDRVGNPMIAGRIFTEFRDEIEGAEIVELDMSISGIANSAFRDEDGDVTIFLSSIVEWGLDLSMSFDAMFPNYYLAKSTQISVDMTTADGIYKDLTNLPHFLEPDVTYNFKVDGHTFSEGGDFLIFSLQPFETIVLTLSSSTNLPIIVPSINYILGTEISEFLKGSEGLNEISGNLGNDTIIGQNSEDYLSGGWGRDSIIGNGGNDVIRGGNGHDSLFGHSGNDTIVGGNGDDSLVGGNDSDKLFGQRGDDTLRGQAGQDTLNGGGGNDFAIGGEGNDWFRMGSGADKVFAGTGRDTVFGNAGDDTLFGGDGNDRLNGGGGIDILNGGKGNDYLVGGEGEDQFIFHADMGRDQIKSFNSNEDTLLFSRALFDIPISAETLIDEYSSVVGKDLVIDLTNGNSVTILWKGWDEDIVNAIDFFG
jgi:hypothetical protein